MSLQFPWTHLNLTSTHYSYIYNLIIAIDANFRLKRRARNTSEQRDPALVGGRGYFVESQAYKNYYMRYASQDDVRMLYLIAIKRS